MNLTQFFKINCHELKLLERSVVFNIYKEYLQQPIDPLIFFFFFKEEFFKKIFINFLHSRMFAYERNEGNFKFLVDFD